MRKLCILLLVALVALSGCWSRTELNDLGIVLGMAVDAGEEEPVRMTFYIPRPQFGGQGGGGAGKPAAVWAVTREAPSISEALQEMRMASSRRIVLDHLRVLLIGEEYARTRGVGELLDALAMNAELRLTLRPFVVEGRAADVFQAVPQLRLFQPMNLVGMMQAKGGVDWRLKNVLVARSSETHSSWMYALKVMEREALTPVGPEEAAVLSGAALFIGDELVMILHPPDSQFLLWFLGSSKGTILSVPCPKPEEGTFSGHVLSGRASVHPHMEGDQVSFLVRVKASVNLSRVQCKLRMNHPEDRRLLEEHMAAYVRRNVADLVERLQKGGVDPAGFGKHLQLAYPRYYKTIGERWKEVWPNAKVTVEARVNIPRSGLLTSPGSKTDEELMNW